MALTPSGTISLGDINTATGKSATAPISMNGTAARCLSNTSEGTSVSMSQLRSKTCAGGTITSGTRTVSGKGGVTTTETGYTTNASPAYGAINNGNIVTYFPNATVIETMRASISSNSSLYFNTFNIKGTSVTGFGGSPRLKVGSNPSITFSYVTFVSPGGPAVYTSNSNPLALVAAADVGVTRDWVVVTP